MKKLLSTLLALSFMLTFLSSCRTQETKPDTLSKNPPEENDVSLLNANFNTYASIISTYRKLVELCPRGESFNPNDYFFFPNDTSLELYGKLFLSTLLLYPHTASGIDGDCYERFGYTLKDLNSDGTDELILRLDDHEVIAIFTMVDNSPVLLDNYWNRCNCWIDTDGLLHVHGSSAADCNNTQIYRLEANSAELTLLAEFGRDGHNEETGDLYFYKLVNGEKVYLPEQEYNDYRQSLPYDKFAVTENISDYLSFIPVFDEEHPRPAPYFETAKG